MFQFKETELREINPVRTPNWRAERALQLLDHRPQPLRPWLNDDHFVRAYYWLISDLRAAENGVLPQQVLKGELTGMYRAHQLHQRAASMCRQTLEAWLLTGAASDQIAVRFGTEPNVIDYYEKVFFNVRDRLNCKAWITKTIIGSRRQHTNVTDPGRMQDRQGSLLRMFAYYGGPLIVEAITEGVPLTQMAALSGGSSRHFAAALADVVAWQTAVAVNEAPLDQFLIKRFLKLGLRARKQPRS